QGCTYKIRLLTEKGVLKSCIPVLNTPLLGYLSFRMYFKLIDITPQKEEEFRKYFVSHELIPWVVGCEGLWDYIIVVFPKDFATFEKFNTDLNNSWGGFIDRKEIALVTEAHHFRSGYILEKKKEMPQLIYAGQPKEPIALNEEEKSILKILSSDSRISLIDMQKKLGISAKNISYKIDKLERLNVIEGYITTVDYEKIGFERYKVFLRTKNLDQKKERTFIQYSKIHPYILYYSRSIGANDVELELIVKDSLHLRQVIAEIRNKFGDIIKSFETMKIHSEYKLNFYPWKL
ncbi:MAG: Lrp/AsnC family transcriptional regulator, partial [Candidatus Woesearchaeota archaeon]